MMKTAVLIAAWLLAGYSTACAGVPPPAGKVDTLCLLKSFQTVAPVSYQFRNELVDSVQSRTQLAGTIFLARKDAFYRLADSLQEQIIGQDAMVFVDHGRKTLRVFRFEDERSRQLAFEQYTHNAIADSLMQQMLRRAHIQQYSISKPYSQDSIVIRPAAPYPIREMRLALRRADCWIERMQVWIPYTGARTGTTASTVYTRGTAWNYRKGVPQELQGLFDNRAQIVPFLTERYKNYKITNL